ncbi:tetratricopeptide repeat protein [Planobispora rosea]|uniref:tetratricopeptide repeat protein n=1 Tax=Planobispora rosea TaxID=35762 RepID=UPI00083AA4AA|nr:tetratricopeptide repeat protein [Planobispora rosea]
MTTDTLIERARTLLKLRRPAEAERELRGVLARDPEHAEAHALLGVTLAEQRMPSEAVAEAREAVRLAPDQWFPHYVAGQIHLMAGRPGDAIAALRAALAIEPEYAPIWRFLSRAHLRAGQGAEAADASRRGLALDPRDAELAGLLALALTALGEAAQAQDAAAQAVRLDPENALAHLAYGRAALAFGDPGHAARAFREVLRLDPGFGEARDLLLKALKRRNPLYRTLDRLRGRFFGRWWVVLLLPAAPMLVIVLLLVALLHWVAWSVEAFTTLRLAHAGVTRLLFERAEVRAARLCCLLLAAGATLIALGVLSSQEVVGAAGAAAMALITPVQESVHTGSPLGRAVLYGWAVLLALVIAVSAVLGSMAAVMLSTYTGLATIWIAAGVRRLFGRTAGGEPR